MAFGDDIRAKRMLYIRDNPKDFDAVTKAWASAPFTNADGVLVDPESFRPEKPQGNIRGKTP